jgi:hypothetical protein
MSKKFKHEGETYTVGEAVRCDVEWKNGRRVNMSGTLISIANGEVFIASELDYERARFRALQETRSRRTRRTRFRKQRKRGR